MEFRSKNIAKKKVAFFMSILFKSFKTDCVLIQTIYAAVFKIVYKNYFLIMLVYKKSKAAASSNDFDCCVVPSIITSLSFIVYVFHSGKFFPLGLPVFIKFTQ